MWLLFVLLAIPPCILGVDDSYRSEDQVIELPEPFSQLPTCLPDYNDTVADPDVCRVYYHCINGYPWPRQCPKDLHYQPTALGSECTFRMCVQPSESGCTDSANAEEKYELLKPYLEEEVLISAEEEEEAETAGTEVEEKQFDYPCFRDSAGNWVDVTLPNRANCNQYYHCDGGISWVSECPPGMYYTPKISWTGPLEDCRFTTCVQYDEAKCAINGGWGEWGAWSDCSVNCGDGVRTRRRPCDDPPPANAGDDCPGLDIDIMLCNEGDCQENSTAVFVATLVDLATGQTEVDPLEFQTVLVNTDGSFNAATNTFTAPVDGNYFMAINSGAMALQPVNMFLKGDTPHPIGNYRTHAGHVGRDSLNSNNIIPLSAGDAVRISAAADTSLAADQGRPTSWAIFNLDDISTTASFFSFAYDSPESNPSNPLQYSINVTEQNSGYDPATGFFRPIFPGIYFLSYGAGVDSTTVNTPIDFTMSCSGACGSEFVSTKMSRAHNDYQGIDTMSRPVIVRLAAGSQIIVTSSQAYWSSPGLPVSFSGFFYQPNIDSRVAWFVARNGDWEDTLPLDPVSFNRVVVNEGDGWGAEINNYYTVPVSGYYLIILSAGALPGKRIDMRFFANDEYIFDLYRQTLAHTDVDIVSRTAIFYFELGDRLRLRAIGNSGLHSSVVGYETSFGGMLLFAGQESTESSEQAQHMFDSMKVHI